MYILNIYRLLLHSLARLAILILVIILIYRYLSFDKKSIRDLNIVGVGSSHCGFVPQLNCVHLLLSFSGCKDAMTENSRKTSAQEVSPVKGTFKKGDGGCQECKLKAIVSRGQQKVCPAILQYSERKPRGFFFYKQFKDQSF